MINYSELDADVVVVGAGLSGLTAAYAILERVPTLVVLVLEGSARIGGRILSVPLMGGDECFSYCDIGGQWISSKQPLICSLVRKFGLKVIKRRYTKGKMLGEFDRILYKTSTKRDFLGNQLEVIQLIHFYALIEYLSAKITFGNPKMMKNWQKYDQMSMEEFIEENTKSKLVHSMIKVLIKGTFGVSANHISVLFYLAFCNSIRGVSNHFIPHSYEYRIEGGAYRLCEEMLKKIEKQYVLTEQPVIKITNNFNDVCITTVDQEYYCSCAIVAIPPQQVLNITYEPMLSSGRVKILQNVNEGRLIKFIATYKKAFWCQKKRSGNLLVWNDNETFVCVDMSKETLPALTGYVSCPRLLPPSHLYFKCRTAIFLDDIETYEPPFKKIILNNLAKFFGEEALKPVSYIEKSWKEEPYTIGSPMNVPGLGFMTDFEEIRKPSGRVFWAGTETSTQWNGFMEGAVNAGYRAAAEVLSCLRPASMRVCDFHYVDSNPSLVDRHKNSFFYIITNWRYMVPLGLLLLFCCLNRRTRNFFTAIPNKLNDFIRLQQQ